MDLTRASIADLKAELERRRTADLTSLRNEVDLICTKGGYTLAQVFFFSKDGKKGGRPKKK